MEEPVSTETIFTSAVLRQVAETYNLNGLSIIGKPDYGIVTDNIFVEADDGRKYFIKYYAQSESEKYAKTYHLAEVLARNEEIPAQVPLPNNQGTYTVAIGSKSLVVFPYIEHTNEPPHNDVEDERLTQNMAELLGRMHAVPVPENDPLLEPLPRWTPEYCVNRERGLRRLQEHISSLSEQSEFDQAALDCIELKILSLRKIPLVSRETSGMTALCHGDFHAHNILRDEEQNIIAIIDFDNAGVAHPYCDFLQTFTSVVVGKDYDAYQAKVEKAKLFSEAYKKGLGKPIDMSELKYAYSIYLHERIGTTFPLYQHYYENNYKNDDRLKHVVARVHFLGDHYEEFFDFIARSI